MEGKKKMIKVGILGAGFAGKMHAPAYAAIPDVEIAVIVDPIKEKAQSLAEQVGARAEIDAEAVFRDPSITLVDIAVPTPLHPELTVRALEVEKHVVLEKPLALTMAEADTILMAAERSEKFLMVAHVLRFWPEYVAIREVIQSGQLGQPLMASAHRLSNRPQWATWFRDPKASGGAVLDLQIHDLDMVNWLFGRPKWVYATGVKGETGGWDHVVAQVEYGTVRAAVEASQLMPQDFPFTAGMRIVCEDGVVEYQFRAGGASFENGSPMQYLFIHKTGTPNQPVPIQAGDAFERQIAYFVECVRSGQPPSIVTPADAYLAVQTSLAARESLETGQQVLLPS
jgi:UDP-N-acetylglucosamine 3-dehydrogenase